MFGTYQKLETRTLKSNPENLSPETVTQLDDEVSCSGSLKAMTHCGQPHSFLQRPWDEQPVLCTIPFDIDRPEALFKLDIFHLFKVGMGRDLVGAIVLIARLGYYDWSPNESQELKQRFEPCLEAFRTLANHGQAFCWHEVL